MNEQMPRSIALFLMMGMALAVAVPIMSANCPISNRVADMELPPRPLSLTRALYGVANVS